GRGSTRRAMGQSPPCPGSRRPRPAGRRGPGGTHPPATRPDRGGGRVKPDRRPDPRLGRCTPCAHRPLARHLLRCHPRCTWRKMGQPRRGVAPRLTRPTFRLELVEAPGPAPQRHPRSAEPNAQLSHLIYVKIYISLSLRLRAALVVRPLEGIDRRL